MSRQIRIRKPSTTLNGTSLQRAARDYDRGILIRKFTEKLKDMRRWAKASWGEKYATRVAPYKSHILLACKNKKCSDPVEIAVKHLSPILGNSKKLTAVKGGVECARVALFSAALDLQDEHSSLRG